MPADRSDEWVGVVDDNTEPNPEQVDAAVSPFGSATQAVRAAGLAAVG
jgi:hypothetical protein